MSVRNRSARRWRRTTRSARRMPVGGEVDGRAVDGSTSPRLHPLDHLGDGRAGDLEALGDAGLDDVDVVLAELEDRLAVLLERGVALGRLVLGHGGESRARRWAPTRLGTADVK